MTPDASSSAPVEKGGARPAPLVYTRREAAKVLRCGLTKITQLISDGRLPSIKVGGSRLVRHNDLQAFIDSLPTDDAA